MRRGAPALLLTGASGLLGSELLPRLAAARPARRIIAVKRPEADITRAGLGLDARTAAGLEQTVTEIIHCAADRRFGLPLEEARTVNTQGARHVLEFARRCRRLEKLAHVSTVYVAGATTGVIREAPVEAPARFFNAYQQSKYEAEQIVMEAGRGLPVAVFRISSMIGDSQTGRVRQFNHVHQLLKLLPRNVLPVAPIDPAAQIDLVPADWTAAALVHLFDHAFGAGRFYHLCAGPASFTVQEMLDCTLEVFESHPAARDWLPLRFPEFVSLPRYEEYVARTRRTSDRLLNELLRVLGYFLPHLALRQHFENRDTLESLAGSNLEPPPVREVYRKVVRYCLDTDWGRRQMDAA